MSDNRGKMTGRFTDDDEVFVFVRDCASHPQEGDFEQEDGVWSEFTDPDTEAALEFYASTVRWARRLIGMVGVQHFDEDGSVSGR